MDGFKRYVFRVTCWGTVVFFLTSCTTIDLNAPPPDTSQPKIRDASPASKKSGGYYQNDGPHDNPPDESSLLALPDAAPKDETIPDKSFNRPYNALGKTYTPQLDQKAFSQEGMASWYGRQFHGRKTSSGELYNMYAMTAAHPTLPIPSYVRVTNLNNQKQVVVRINDRGPFHGGRIIDLSYTAALKLDYIKQGSTKVKVERLFGVDVDQAKKDELARAGDVKKNSLALTVASAPVVMLSSSVAVAPLPEETVGGGGATVATGIPQYFLQMGNFSSPEAAKDMVAKNQGQVSSTLSIIKDEGAYKVVAGPFADLTELRQKQKQLREQGFSSFLLKK
jgi:rare lipoprotein A